jgi:cobalt-zinc-cadmium efflux system membrane fusion protein
MIKKFTFWIWLMVSFSVHAAATAAEVELPSVHAEEHGDEDHPKNAIVMDAAARRNAGVETAVVTRRSLTNEVRAPGEVRANAYATSKVTPRIQGQIVRRHAKLGDRVTNGAPLVTLTSVEMAQAQGELLVADREWRRVRKLGREVVSERRYVEAQVMRQQAEGKVLAFGLTPEQVTTLLKQSDASKATGAFVLFAPQDGTVISDDFIVGEVVEPGRMLFEIMDESVLWVEAQFPVDDGTAIAINSPASIRASEAWLPGRVVQIHHRINETTRTFPVRVEVHNLAHTLHPGQFVEVRVSLGIDDPVIVVPRSAVVLMQGSYTVFKQEGDELHAQPIEVGRTQDGWTEITAGLTEGEEVVVNGVYVLKSIMLKDQTGAGHGH